MNKSKVAEACSLVEEIARMSDILAITENMEAATLGAIKFKAKTAAELLNQALQEVGKP